MRRISRRLIGVVMAVAMAAAWGATQDTDRPQAMFFAPVEVPLVSVEVYVFDGSGRPVPGLTRGDFEIFEDGEKVEISHFYASPGMTAPARGHRRNSGSGDRFRRSRAGPESFPGDLFRRHQSCPRAATGRSRAFAGFSLCRAAPRSTGDAGALRWAKPHRTALHRGDG